MTARMLVAAAAVSAIGSFASAATTFTFDSLVHGEIVDNQFAPALTVSGVNNSRPHDFVVAFDTNMTGTADPDLQGPPWAGGNLAPANENLGRVLIIPENGTDADGDGLIDSPDDEARRPAGTITLAFDQSYTTFGIDFVDLEGQGMEASGFDFYNNGTLVFSTTVATIAAGDASIAFGNNYANRIAAFDVAAYDTVVINVGGSSAWDNVVVPAPGTAALALAGLMAAGRRRR